MEDVKDNNGNTPSLDPGPESGVDGLIVFLRIGPQKHAAPSPQYEPAIGYLSPCLSVHPMRLAGNAKSHPLQESTQIRFVQTRFLPLPVGTYLLWSVGSLCNRL